MPMCQRFTNPRIRDREIDPFSNVVKLERLSFANREEYILYLNNQGYKVRIGEIMLDKIESSEGILYGGIRAGNDIWFPKEELNKDERGLISKIKQIFSPIFS